MSTILQQLINSVSVGGLYALLAVGYALIYSVFDFTNFAFGGIMMVSAFAGYFSTQLGLGTIPAMFVAMAAGVALSVAVELLAYRPMRKRNAKRLFLMISAMGVNIFSRTCFFAYSVRILERCQAALRQTPLPFGVYRLVRLILLRSSHQHIPSDFVLLPL